MVSSGLSFDEGGRLPNLRDYNILDTSPNNEFDAITTIVANICKTPISVITFVDAARQWFESSVGFIISQNSREVSFCEHVIENRESIFVVPDARQDKRFAENLLVTGNPKIRYYAGAPLVSNSGVALGSLCVVDRVPRILDPDQLSALKSGAAAVVALLEHRRTMALLGSCRDRAAGGVPQADAALVSGHETLPDIVRSVAKPSLEAMRNLPASRIIDALPGPFYMCGPSGDFLLWNRFLEELSGYSAAEISGMNSLELFAPDDVAYISERILKAFIQGYATAEVDVLTKDSRRIPYFLNGRAFDFEGQRCFAGMGVDISERKRIEDLLKHSALHDALTGLPNRLLLGDRLIKTVLTARRNDRHAAVIFLDIDRLKNVNDTLDHRAGDDLIKAVAGRLLGAVRSSDTVARMGGGQYVIVSDVAKRDDVAAIVASIAATFHNPFVIAGHELRVTASIGISISPEDGDEAETLIRNADTAMYQAKASGRNRHYFYTSDMHAAAARRLSTENDLRVALERGEFVLYYQPTVELSTGKIVSAEALIRWQHPTRGLLAPAEFIDIAEETNLIVPIGAWVLREGVREAKRLIALGVAPSHISVNVSGRQLRDPGFLTDVRTALQDSHLPANAVGIEITESAALGDPDAAQTTLAACKQLGLLVLLDDFGTRYSSLTYLKKFPIDVIKIDKSFVDGLPNDADDGRIIDAIIGLGKSLECDILAEGVELEAQARWLDEHNCRFATGYFYARPLPAAEFERLLLRERAAERYAGKATAL